MSGTPLDAVGTVLSGTYQIERKIAEGGMGIVYEAKHVRLPRRFAIKVLSRPTEGIDSGVALERFKREAQVASALKNPHVVQIYDYQIAEGGFPYIVMEMLEGEDLAHRLKRGVRPTPAQTVRIVAEIADALDAAHALGVIHRDLKPANIFLSQQPTPDFVKVLDFGVSKMMNLATITRTDALVGTPLYMSPEQAGGTEDLTSVSDVFALGAIAYEMLTGARAFAGKSIPAILYQVVHADPTPASKALPPQVRDVDAVFAQVLAKDRRMRYPSAGRFARALEISLQPLLQGDPREPVDERTRVRGGEASSATTSAPLLTGPETPVETPLAEAPEEPTRLGRRTPTPPAPSVALAPVRPPSGPQPALYASSPSSLAWGEAVPAPEPVSRFGAGRLAVAGAVIVLVATVTTIGFRRGAADAKPQAETIPTTSSAAAPADPPALPPAQVTVTLQVLPGDAHATVFLDDDLVTGSKVIVPWRSQPRQLRVVAPGYFTIERAVDVTSDRVLELTLQPDLAPSGVVARPSGRPLRGHPATPPRIAVPPTRPSIDPPRHNPAKLAAPVQDL